MGERWRGNGLAGSTTSPGLETKAHLRISWMTCECLRVHSMLIIFRVWLKKVRRPVMFWPSAWRTVNLMGKRKSNRIAWIDMHLVQSSCFNLIFSITLYVELACNGLLEPDRFHDRRPRPKQEVQSSQGRACCFQSRRQRASHWLWMLVDIAKVLSHCDGKVGRESKIYTLSICFWSVLHGVWTDTRRRRAARIQAFLQPMRWWICAIQPILVHLLLLGV